MAMSIAQDLRKRAGHVWARRLPLLGLVVLSALPMNAHEFITTNITWNREISRVFHRRCISCHHSGGPAFDLSSYRQVRPWAEAIKHEVLERRMPPWGAIKGFGTFQNEDALSETEIALISSWVEGGAPQGDPGLLPKQTTVGKAASLPSGTTETLSLAGGTLTLKQTVRIAAVRPETLPEGASLRLIAQRRDGAIEPLLWLYRYAPRFRRTYYFKTPMTFRAGTKIQMVPPVGSLSLLLAGE